MDVETDLLVRRARDLITANVMWGYLLETSRAGLPVTLRILRDVAEGVAEGDLPDRGLMSPRDRVHLPYGSLIAS